MPPISVTICIPTFRRPFALARALASAAGQRFERCAAPEVRIAVVENDPARLAEAVVERARASSPWPIAYEVEPRPGISFARNRLVAMAAGADYLAMLDDDEEARPGWLDALLAVALDRDADAVLGPVEPAFEAPPPTWLRPCFERRRHPTGSRVTADDFRTGNLLVAARALALVDGPFNPALALSGGEDSLLGRQLERASARFFWADDAVVLEHLPARRTASTEVLARRFHAGANLARIRVALQGGRRAAAPIVVKSCGLLALGGARIATAPLGGAGRLFAGAAEIAWAAGSLAGLAGAESRGYAYGRRSSE